MKIERNRSAQAEKRIAVDVTFFPPFLPSFLGAAAARARKWPSSLRPRPPRRTGPVSGAEKTKGKTVDTSS